MALHAYSKLNSMAVYITSSERFVVHCLHSMLLQRLTHVHRRHVTMVENAPKSLAAFSNANAHEDGGARPAVKVRSAKLTCVDVS